MKYVICSQKLKVVVTRDLGLDILGKFKENPSVDVRRSHSFSIRRRVDIARAGCVGVNIVGDLASRSYL